MKRIQEKLTKLGYSNDWLNFGVLTKEQLISQIQLFKTDDDQNKEHYRYGTFRQYLTKKQVLTDVELDNYIKLVFADEDTFMAGAALNDVFTSVQLSDVQFQTVTQKIELFDGD